MFRSEHFYSNDNYICVFVAIDVICSPQIVCISFHRIDDFQARLKNNYRKSKNLISFFSFTDVHGRGSWDSSITSSSLSLVGKFLGRMLRSFMITASRENDNLDPLRHLPHIPLVNTLPHLYIFDVQYVIWSVSVHNWKRGKKKKKKIIKYIRFKRNNLKDIDILLSILHN